MGLKRRVPRNAWASGRRALMAVGCLLAACGHADADHLLPFVSEGGSDNSDEATAGHAGVASHPAPYGGASGVASVDSGGDAGVAGEPTASVGGGSSVNIAGGTGDAAGAAGESGSSEAGGAGTAGTPGTASFDCSGGFVRILPKAQPVLLSACGEITTSGVYTLSADLANAYPDCLKVHDVSNVRIDCQGRTLKGFPALSVTNVDGFEVENCRFVPSNPAISPLNIDHGSNGAVHDSIVEARYSQVQTSHHLFVYNNQYNCDYQQDDSHDCLIACNVMHTPYSAPDTGTSLVTVTGGSHNRIIENQIDGGWDGVLTPVRHKWGSDDGIFVNNEHDDLVQHNLVRNNWDAAIETLGTVTDSVFSENTLQNSGYCGIGGWYASSVLGNTFAHNTVDGARQLFSFFRIGAPVASEQLLFHGNRFEHNTFMHPLDDSPAANLPVYAQMGLPGSLSEEQFVLSDNSFTGNEFGPLGTQLPDFGAGTVIPGVIVDGGGNTCGKAAPNGFPLACSPN